MQSEFHIILRMIAKEACERLLYLGHDCAKTYLWYPIQICKNEIGIMLHAISWGVGRVFFLCPTSQLPNNHIEIYY